MMVESKCIQDIIAAAGKSPDDMRQVLQANYEKLDAKAAAPGGVFVLLMVNAAFDAIDNSSQLVKDCRRGAQVIAGKLDIDADGTDGNPYHNKLHAAKVLMNSFALAMMHIHQQEGKMRLPAESIAELLLSSVGHDIGHNGQGNVRDGQHEQFLLEKNSIYLARDWLVESGMGEAGCRTCLNALELVYGTDVSGNPSPAHRIRKIYDDTCRGKDPDLFDLPREMSSIVGASSVVLAALLQDADVMASVLTPARSWAENQRVAAEMDKAVTPEFTAGFLKYVVGGRMTTDVARALCDENIAAMTAMVEKGIVPGMPIPNKPTAQPDKPDSYKL